MADKITYDEIVNSYEFKLTEKILKREYPWIKKLDIRPEDLENYRIIFLDVFIDPYELAKEKGWKINWFMVNDLRKGRTSRENFLTLFFNISYEDHKDVMKEIDDILHYVKKSPAIPRDLKLQTERQFAVGSWVSMPNLEIPPDAENYELEFSNR